MHASVAIPFAAFSDGGGKTGNSNKGVVKPPLIKTRSLEKDFEFRIHNSSNSNSNNGGGGGATRFQWCSRRESQVESIFFSKKK